MTDASPHVCTRYHEAIELIGARWSGAIISAVFKGNHRFAEIKASIPGVSDTMLAQRLQELEHAGLLQRTQCPGPGVASRPDYSLTQMGRELEPVQDAIVTWAHKWMPLGEGATE